MPGDKAWCTVRIVDHPKGVQGGRIKGFVQEIEVLPLQPWKPCLYGPFFARTRSLSSWNIFRPLSSTEGNCNAKAYIDNCVNIQIQLCASSFVETVWERYECDGQESISLFRI